MNEISTNPALGSPPLVAHDPCDAVRSAVRTGNGVPAALQGHVGSCQGCAALSSEVAEFLRADAALSEGAVGSVDLRAGFDAELKKESGVRGFLRSRPTWQRVLVPVGLIVGLVFASAFLASNSGFSLGRTLVHLTVMAGLLSTATFLSLRPMGRPAIPRLAAWGVIGASIVIPLALYAMPGSIGAEGGVVQPALKCFAFGAVFAAGVVLLIRVFDRGARPLSLVLAAAAAGLGANLILSTRCAATGFFHLLSGHVSVILGYALCAAVISFWPARKPKNH